MAMTQSTLQSISGLPGLLVLEPKSQTVNMFRLNWPVSTTDGPNPPARMTADDSVDGYRIGRPKHPVPSFAMVTASGSRLLLETDSETGLNDNLPSSFHDDMPSRTILQYSELCISWETVSLFKKEQDTPDKPVLEIPSIPNKETPLSEFTECWPTCQNTPLQFYFPYQAIQHWLIYSLHRKNYEYSWRDHQPIATQVSASNSPIR